MIPIGKNINPSIVNHHQDAICHYLDSSPFLRNKKARLERLIAAFTKKRFTFKTLLTAPFATIEKQIVPYWDRFPAALKEFYSEEIHYFHTYYSYLGRPKHFSFSEKENEIRTYYNTNYLFQHLDIFVCPYCNENYTYHTTQSGKRNYDIDHFFSQADYPILSLSFYNLIPACKQCNFYKLDKPDPILSPYHDYRIDDILRWGLKVSSAGYLLDKNQFEIKIAYQTKQPYLDKIDNNINVFDLQNRYAERKDIIADLLRKKQVYNSDYIEQLFKSFEGKLFSNLSDVHNMIFNTSFNEDQYPHRPFSKLIRDIFQSEF